MIARVLWNWLQLRHNQWLPIKELEKIQFRKLKTLLTHAYEKVPFYKRFYDEHGVHPDMLRTLDDIRRFPIISKEIARDTSLEDKTAIDVDVSKCTLKTTSGSTGIPVKILEDDHSIDYLDAYHLRRMFEYGYKPWEKIIRLTTEPPEKELLGEAGEARTGLMKRIRENRIKRLVVTDDIERHLEIMKKENPQFIIASPSYLRVIAKAVSEQGITTVRPRVLVTWGEVLDEGTREYLTSHLGSQVYNGYGCTEAAPLGMAWECKERAGLHINCDVVLLEILKEGEPVSPGEKGEVFVTSLFRFSTPMIRYRLGDIVTLSDENCPCGREMPMIKNIEGRMVDFIKMPNGRLISPYALMSVVQDIPGIAKYQIVQATQDRIVATIEMGKGFTENTVIQVRNSCSELLDSDIQFDIDIVDRLPIAKGRKFRAVESRI